MRKIIHVDMDAFFASVEQRDNTELRGKPVIVGGKPDSRGVVAACSYEARKFGIHSAMPSSRAYQLCPDAVFVRPRFEAYREASQQIHRIFKSVTKLIEPLSLDEAYLDVTEACKDKQSATEIARQLKKQIKQTTNLTASAGVSYNKFLAKIASDMDKPDGLYVIKPHQAQPFIDQLEIRKFFGVGKVTEKKMQALGIYNGKDLRSFSKVQLQTQFGRSGEYYFNVARGIDNRAVKSSRKRKSIGKEITFGENLVDKNVIWDKLNEISLSLEKILQKNKIIAKTLTLKVKYSDFQLITRSKTDEGYFTNQQQMMNLLPTLLKKTDVGKRPIRLVGLSLSNLHSLDSQETRLHSKDIANAKQLGLLL